MHLMWVQVLFNFYVYYREVSMILAFPTQSNKKAKYIDFSLFVYYN